MSDKYINKITFSGEDTYIIEDGHTYEGGVGIVVNPDSRLISLTPLPGHDASEDPKSYGPHDAVTLAFGQTLTNTLVGMTVDPYGRVQSAGGYDVTMPSLSGSAGIAVDNSTGTISLNTSFSGSASSAGLNDDTQTYEDGTFVADIPSLTWNEYGLLTAAENHTFEIDSIPVIGYMEPSGIQYPTVSAGGIQIHYGFDDAPDGWNGISPSYNGLKNAIYFQLEQEEVSTS